MAVVVQEVVQGLGRIVGGKEETKIKTKTSKQKWPCSFALKNLMILEGNKTNRGNSNASGASRASEACVGRGFVLRVTPRAGWLHLHLGGCSGCSSSSCTVHHLMGFAPRWGWWFQVYSNSDFLASLLAGLQSLLSKKWNKILRFYLLWCSRVKNKNLVPTKWWKSNNTAGV